MNATRLIIILAAMNIAPLPAIAQTAAAGVTAFGQCAMCHATNAAKPSVGPHLAGILGRKAGSVAGYAYSPALKASNIVWNRDRLAAFVTNPQAVVKGTKMYFAGIKDAKTRAILIAYLGTLKK